MTAEEKGYIVLVKEGGNVYKLTEAEFKKFNEPFYEKFAESIKEMEEYFKEHPEERIEMFGY